MKKTIWLIIIAVLFSIPFIKNTKIISRYKVISEHKVLKNILMKDQKYYTSRCC